VSSQHLRNIEEKYDEIVRFLYGLERFGILLGLENITRLLEQLGNPHREFPVVHVAGSNGKGSTSSLIYGILREAGYKTALYTSPHLNDFRERIKVNGSLIPKEALIESTEKVLKIYDPERTTFFEFTTAVAFDYLAQTKPDLAVIEVGLGGRLDATNTVSPLVTVITDISREHEDYLGVGIAAIAGEKAGVIKPNVPLITGASRAQARKIIMGKARELSAPVREFGKHFKGIRTGSNLFTYRSEKSVIEKLHIRMPGSYQIKNASLALAVVEELSAQGFTVPAAAIRTGLAETVFPGRFEILMKQPDVIIDGAHTPEGMRLLKSTFGKAYPGVRPLLLLGMLRDKNYEALVRIIAPMAKEVVCVAPQGARALDPEQLAVLVRSLDVPASPAAGIVEGFELLRNKAKAEDVILAAGSLYMIGPVRQACGLSDDG
jgi:dihydrofolate synthase / folylpolyglutamate synthase